MSIMEQEITVGWVNPYTGTRYARELRFRCALDNYEPTRNYGGGALREFVDTDGRITYQIHDPSAKGEGYRALYLMDDGRTVRPYYVAGWSGATGWITLHPMPTDWMLGPRTAYHLKIAEV